VPHPLHAHEIRWFYQEPGKYWQPFNGYDSLALEDCYRHMDSDTNQESAAAATTCSSSYEVMVIGDMYEVNLVENQCKPIYWTGKRHNICMSSYIYYHWQHSTIFAWVHVTCIYMYYCWLPCASV
jgi:hypothetical protein